MEFEPMATAPVPVAIVLLGVYTPSTAALPPMAMADVLVVAPPPVAYCACTALLPAPAISTAVVTALVTADLFGLPLAESISDTATHAPRDSFQIDR
ncbi:hypothetical protein [Burkholderia glumae]|uniref:hypothetical protein n=2 Tax=Burkholderia glumae TaxID=337 RepID=UPI00037F5FA4|nr:hypothetical protein [Burkholderia glumae]KHJ59923.1 hypothetical protein NCPPB3923_26795 [Burkholderia glumae]QGA40188.1 hypothetical protein GAS19_21795 [Burkholderia glumae]